MDNSSSKSTKTRFTFTAILFILVFFFTILLFSKRTLEPSVSVYHQSLSLTTSHIHDPPPSPPPAAAVEPLNSSTHYQDPVPSISQADKLEPSSSPTRVDIDDVLPAPEEKQKPVADDGADPEKRDVLPAPEEKQKPVADDGADSEKRDVLPVLEEKQNPAADDGAEPEKRIPPPDNVVVHNVEEKKRGSCDIYTGTWVKDEQYPIYKPGSCPYVDEAFDCSANGRKDSDYLRWRWKPDHCNLPRYNAIDFLERLRGKKLMVVGDSVNRNQFESLLCLLHEGLTNKSKMYEVYGHKVSKGRGYFLFKIEDYDCTVEFVRSHFLVRGGVRSNAPGHSSPILSIDKIDKSSGKWKRADILIFNTGHWWVHGKTARGINYYKEGDYIYPKFDSMEAYRRALKTWGKWIDANINPAKQLVFFRGYSPAHFRGGDWDSGGSCHGETEPILSREGFVGTYPPKMKIVEEVIREMKAPVVLLNITSLTSFRKDGHPSIYRKKKVSTRRQDCSHWCLPGVPDTWNELIYATLFFNEQFPGG